MSAIGRPLCGGLSLQLLPRIRIAAVEVAMGGGWQLRIDSDAAIGPFDSVAVAAPAPPAAPLLAASPALAAGAASVEMAPCIAALVAFAKPVACAADGAFVKGPVLASAARSGSKPARPADECWVLHGAAPSRRTVLEDEPAVAALRLLDGFAAAIGGSLPASLPCDAHRRRYALPETPIREACLWDAERRLGARGDWCLGGRVEAIFESGNRLAQRMSGPDGTAAADSIA